MNNEPSSFGGKSTEGPTSPTSDQLPPHQSTDAQSDAEHAATSQPEPGATTPPASQSEFAQQTGTQPPTPSDAVPAGSRRSPIFGTIFWGVVLLVFAVIMIVLAIPTITVDVATLTITTLVALGALLVVAGVAASVRNRRR